MLLAVVGLVLGWSGCATFTPSDRASISLVTVRSFKTTFLETSFDLVLRVTNETNQPLHFEGSSHQVFVNGDKVGRGVRRTPTAVPPLSTATIVVPVHVENLALLGRFGVRMPEEVNYRLESKLFTSTAGEQGLGVLTEGVFDLRPYKDRWQADPSDLEN